MDRRMNRGYMGNNCGCDKKTSPYRSNDSVCGDVGGRMHDDDCGKHMHEDNSGKHMHEDDCGRHMHEDDCGKHMHEDDCGRHMDDCDHFDVDRFPIGMCYVPWQCFRNIYENEFTALAKGTMFKELDLDWYGRGCK